MNTRHLRYVTLLTCLHWSVVWFWGVIGKCFLVWISFTAHKKENGNKLAEKMGRDQTVGQLFCNAHAARAWLCLTFILLFYLIHSFFYKHTGKLGWSSICLIFSQFEPEIMFDGILNFKTHFMVWYCVWYEHYNGLF